MRNDGKEFEEIANCGGTVARAGVHDCRAPLHAHILGQPVVGLHGDRFCRLSAEFVLEEAELRDLGTKVDW